MSERSDEESTSAGRLESCEAYKNSFSQRYKVAQLSSSVCAPPSTLSCALEKFKRALSHELSRRRASHSRIAKFALGTSRNRSFPSNPIWRRALSRRRSTGAATMDFDDRHHGVQRSTHVSPGGRRDCTADRVYPLERHRRSNDLVRVGVIAFFRCARSFATTVQLLRNRYLWWIFWQSLQPCSSKFWRWPPRWRRWLRATLGFCSGWTNLFQDTYPHIGSKIRARSRLPRSRMQGAEIHMYKRI